jgi:thiol-disulfide isomerase/thioredoxin
VIAFLLAANVLAGELDAAGVHRVVQAHRGRPVLVSFWATWCAPCVQEFPQIMALARRRKDVDIVSVSIDDAGDRSVVETFVQEHQPPFPVYTKAPGPDDVFIDGVDRDWKGSVPALLIVGASGKKLAFVEGELTPAEIEERLDSGRRPR